MKLLEIRLVEGEHAEIVKKNNKSGVVGVPLHASETARSRARKSAGSGSPHGILADGRAKRIKFSVKKYGEEGAFKLAVKARRGAVKQMAGNFDPGATRRKKRLSRI
jgi:CRISPR/Cas system CMR-associated protein Cmr1 (group 7 of RAMP superfamily)